MKRLTITIILFLIVFSTSVSASEWWNTSYDSRIAFNVSAPATIDMNYTFQKTNLSIGYLSGERWIRNSTQSNVPFNVTRNGTGWHEIVFKINHPLPANTNNIYYMYRNNTAAGGNSTYDMNITRLCLADVPDSETLPAVCFTDLIEDVDIVNESVKFVTATGRIVVGIPSMVDGTLLMRLRNLPITNNNDGSIGDGVGYRFYIIQNFDGSIYGKDNSVPYRHAANGTPFNYVNYENLAFSASFDTIADNINVTMIREDGTWYINRSWESSSASGALQSYRTGRDPEIMDEIVMLPDHNIMMPPVYVSVKMGNEESKLPDTSPPLLSSFNCTSCVIDTTPNQAPYKTEDTTPTFTFVTDENAWCRISDKDWNYSLMGSSRDCTSGQGLINHTCTLTSQDQLISGTDYVYIGCKDLFVNENQTSSSGALQMEITNITSVVSNVDSAMTSGITNSVIWPGVIIYTNQPVYVRTIINNQAFATFDKVAVYGSQRWAFNYISENETSIGAFYNLTPVFYFLEMQNLSSSSAIENQVSSFINSTKR